MSRSQSLQLLQNAWFVVGSLRSGQKLICLSGLRLAIDDTSGWTQYLSRRGKGQSFEITVKTLDTLIDLTIEESNHLLDSDSLNQIYRHETKESFEPFRKNYENKKKDLATLPGTVEQKAIPGLETLSKTYAKPSVFDAMKERLQYILGDVQNKLQSIHEEETRIAQRNLTSVTNTVMTNTVMTSTVMPHAQHVHISKPIGCLERERERERNEKGEPL